MLQYRSRCLWNQIYLDAHSLYFTQYIQAIERTIESKYDSYLFSTIEINKRVHLYGESRLCTTRPAYLILTVDFK